MNARIAWIIALAFLLAFEMWALVRGQQTLSEEVWALSHNWPLIPFLAGMLAAHFFWQSARVYARYKDGKDHE